MHNVLVGQSGGPTAAINSSLAGVYETARGLGAGVIGMRYGIEGLFDDKLFDLSHALRSPVDVQLLRQTPSSYLGSCRYKLPAPEQDEQPYEYLFGLFERHRIGTVLYIEGIGYVEVQDRGGFGEGIIDLHIGWDSMDSFEDKQRAVYIVKE